MRALLVEDDPDVGQHVLQALQEAGFVVDWSRDGNDAWFKGDVEEFDVAILDLGLPQLDGLSVLKRWRAASGPAGCPARAGTSAGRRPLPAPRDALPR